MDTKSKGKYIPLVALLVSFYLLSLSLLATIDVFSNKQKLSKDYYFSTYSFTEKLDQFSALLERRYTEFKDYEKKSTAEKFPTDSLEDLQRQHKAELDEKIQAIKRYYDSEYTAETNYLSDEEIKKWQTQKLAEIQKKYEEESKDLVKYFLLKKDKLFKELTHSLSKRDSSFHYYIQNEDTKEVFKNIESLPDQEELKTKTLYYTKFPISNLYEHKHLTSVHNRFKQHDWSGYIMIPATISKGNQIYTDYTYYLSIRDRLIKECIVGIVSFVGLIWIGIYLVKKKQELLPTIERMAQIIRRIPIDIRIFLLGIVSLITLISSIQTSFFYSPPDISHVFILTIFALLFAYITLHIYEAWYLMKDREQLQIQWQKSCLYQLKIIYQESILYKSLLFKVVLLAILSAGFGFSCLLILWGMVDNGGIPILLGFFYNMFYLLFIVPLTLRRIGTLNKIMKATEFMAAGQLSLHIEEPKAGNFKELVHNLNNMREGLKKSLDSQMKSEKLKTELITNVSHDLRTPLTSIMNYVGFLKQDTLTPEESKEYINILDQKTHRLKVLIDDLIEASKVASGAIEMHVEQVDIVALLKQALAEFTDKIPASGLTFRLHVDQPKILVHVDGKKTWRVFENLISNAIKYSLPTTRVHLSLDEEADRVLFTIKNVSAYEIPFEVSELFERFKRGDQSRHTEGSGLGLAIAKSIMDLQGGELHIDIDGDYFKVMAVFPKQILHETKPQS
ncbi:sensor histidine kinase [Brevibacillus laterosporus]|uniref:sensor histidine kinase n=1 Tax=Brevibacillus laterosporus TaxID=1465 RepID=UPI000E6CE13A|nr:HAMP domain-containing sensor histidine kinase [Brevibacillus laterosporus]AYB40630.1 GHKL domain-containing protein [Brevibacillus laterosporus]MBM7107172.1 Sensor protein kinase WalK [Brevibacillus laterosporus]